MKVRFADRMNTSTRSFIREILKVAESPDIISFAGGLPSPQSFPQRELAEAAQVVMSETPDQALQYSATEGFLPLRQWIADRYRMRFGWEVSSDEILITNGSQQGVDLLGKILLNAGDSVVMEAPGYLGAWQAFALYQPEVFTVPLEADGPNLERLEQLLEQHPVRMMYVAPNFQNPSGITYSERKRRAVASLLRKHETILIEDDPYGELRFEGTAPSSFRTYLNNQCCVLGTFSKMVSPGLRIGWVYAPAEVMEKLVIAKQAADLQSNHLAQRIIHTYLIQNDVDRHLNEIQRLYRERRDLMLDCLKAAFPADVKFNKPQGGMFLWGELPNSVDVQLWLERAIRNRVAFVPGAAFYPQGDAPSSLRLNFSNADPGSIETGIQRLRKAYG